MKYPQDHLKEQTMKNAAEGLSWYRDWLAGEDVGEPPKDKLTIWLDYAIEVLEVIEDNPNVKEIIDYA